MKHDPWESIKRWNPDQRELMGDLMLLYWREEGIIHDKANMFPVWAGFAMWV